MFRCGLTSRFPLVMIAALTLAVAGCEEDPVQASKAGTFAGTPVTVGNGTAKTWVTLDNSGNPTAAGITFTEAALTGLSDSTTQSFDILMPSQASATGYNHVGFDWNPKGHPPMDIYGAGHFDIHFYTISKEDRMKITTVGEDSVKTYKMPEADYIPAGYFLPPGPGVPTMGTHWLDTAAAELHPGHVFDKTLIYGFYNGMMTFVEPMITKAYLETKPNVTENLKLPVKYPQTGMYYATKYSVKFDDAKKEYTVALEGLTKR